MPAGHQRIRVVLALTLTLAVLYTIPNRPAALVLLMLMWGALFFPISLAELAAFGVAGVFFLAQNYVCLRAGLFEFRDKDLLLMPIYEPFLWGFYFLGLKRWVAGRPPEGLTVGWKAVAGLAATSTAFSIFSSDSGSLLAATAASTTLLFALFHARGDLYFGVAALALGFIVELFGVSAGLWSYPSPDFLGIPYWFATMWLSVGVLGRRFLLPSSEWLARRVSAG